jgi:hypothetical protein
MAEGKGEDCLPNIVCLLSYIYLKLEKIHMREDYGYCKGIAEKC